MVVGRLRCGSRRNRGAFVVWWAGEPLRASRHGSAAVPGRLAAAQPKSMFMNMNAEFSCTMQPLPMLMRVNIEIGCDLKPK